MRKRLLLLPIGVLALAALWVSMLTLTSGSLIASGEGDLTTRSPKVTDGGTSWTGASGSRDIVWDNGWAYNGIASTQLDEQYPFESIIADDFIFAANQPVNDVHWIGGYWGGPPDDGDFDWVVRFYVDDGTGTKPGSEIILFYFANADVNEVFIEEISGSFYYSYSVSLSVPLTFSAGTKYWISIQGIGVYPPQSGWAYHTDPILLSEGVFKSDFFGYPNWTGSTVAWGEPYDFCFQLTYEQEQGCDWNPGNPYKMHYPQLPDTTGWDIKASYMNYDLADDWLCTESGFVTDIHFWGSWYDGTEGSVDFFSLIIYSDIPAEQSPTGYSMPGENLWSGLFFPGQYDVIPLQSESWEGWYDPEFDFWLEDDHQQYFQYNVCIDTNWFYQEKDSIYWLKIHAETTMWDDWGWKSSNSHWNDNAVWSSFGSTWEELYEPPNFDQPIDLAFVITNGETGDCYVNIGEADASGAIDIDDVVYLIAYIFSGGPAAVPYTTASGDATCDCTVDIDDVVYLIAYIFSGGPTPCACEVWEASCGAIR